MASSPAAASASPDSTEHRDSLVDIMPEAVIRAGLDHRVQSWSRGAERMFGFTQAEALGKEVYALIRPGLSPEAAQLINRRLAAEGHFTERSTRVRKGGTTFATETTFTLLRDGAGQPQGILGVIRDATQLQREHAAALEEARFRGLAEQSNEAELVVALDGAIVEANQRATELYGRTREELLQLTVAQLRTPRARATFPSQLVAATAGPTRFETEHRGADGSPFPVAVSTRPFSVRGQSYQHCLIRDLTQERHQQAQLRLLARITTNMSDAVLVTDEQLRVTEYTGAAEKLFRRPRALVLGQHLIGLFDTEFLSATRQEVAALLAARQEVRVQARLHRDDGFPLVIDYVIAPQVDDEGRPSGWLAVGRDLTAQLASTRALAAREEELRSLVTSMAEGMVVLSAEGRVLSCNPSAERILGMSLGEMDDPASRGVRYRTVREDGSPFPAEEAPARVTLATGKAVSRAVMGVETPDGATRWLSVSSEPLRHAPGEPPYAAVATFTDITELRRATYELTEALAKARALTGLLPICMYCKRVRDDRGYWEQIEAYVASRTGARFSHGVCASCHETQFAGEK